MMAQVTRKAVAGTDQAGRRVRPFILKECSPLPVDTEPSMAPRQRPPTPRESTGDSQECAPSGGAGLVGEVRDQVATERMPRRPHCFRRRVAG